MAEESFRSWNNSNSSNTDKQSQKQSWTYKNNHLVTFTIESSRKIKKVDKKTENCLFVKGSNIRYAPSVSNFDKKSEGVEILSEDATIGSASSINDPVVQIMDSSSNDSNDKPSLFVPPQTCIDEPEVSQIQDIPDIVLNDSFGWNDMNQATWNIQLPPGFPSMTRFPTSRLATSDLRIGMSDTTQKKLPVSSDDRCPASNTPSTLGDFGNNIESIVRSKLTQTITSPTKDKIVDTSDLDKDLLTTSAININLTDNPHYKRPEVDGLAVMNDIHPENQETHCSGSDGVLGSSEPNEKFHQRSLPRLSRSLTLKLESMRRSFPQEKSRIPVRIPVRNRDDQNERLSEIKEFIDYKPISSDCKNSPRRATETQFPKDNTGMMVSYGGPLDLNKVSFPSTQCEDFFKTETLEISKQFPNASETDFNSNYWDASEVDDASDSILTQPPPPSDFNIVSDRESDVQKELDDDANAKVTNDELISEGNRESQSPKKKKKVRFDPGVIIWDLDLLPEQTDDASMDEFSDVHDSSGKTPDDNETLIHQQRIDDNKSGKNSGLKAKGLRRRPRRKAWKKYRNTHRHDLF